MKQIKKQTVAKPAIILLIISAILLLLPACRNNNNPPETTDDTRFTDTDRSSDTDPSDTSLPPDTDRPQATIVFKRNSETNCVIVVPDNATGAEKNAAKVITNAFRLYLGIRIETVADTAQENADIPEIVVGNTNRDKNGIWNPTEHRLGDCMVAVSDNKIFVNAGSDAAMDNAVEKFIGKYLRGAGDTVTVTAGERIDFSPEYAIKSITLNGAEMRGTAVSPTPGLSGNVFVTEAGKMLAESLTKKYGYGSSYKILSDNTDSRSTLILATSDTAPEYRDAIGDRAAVLCSVNGKAAIVARNVSLLSAAVRAFADGMESVSTNGTIAVSDGAVTYDYKAGDILKAMSFNILGSSDIEKRKPAVLWKIAAEYPDVFGIQEGKQEWLDWFDRELDGIYTAVGKGTAEAGHTATYDNIYYRSDRFDLISSDTVWLSDTPNVPGSKFEVSKRVRIATYALLRDKATGKEILFVNTHLDNASSEARLKQAEVLLSLLSGYDCAKVVTGDFNSYMTSAVYAKMTSVLSDSRTDAAKKDTAPTFNRLGVGEGTILDYIFFSKASKDGSTEILEYRVADELYVAADSEKIYPSDHNAITASFRLK